MISRLQSGNILSDLKIGGGFAPTRADCYKGVVALGLSPDTEYEGLANNVSDFGWSSSSPSAMFPLSVARSPRRERKPSATWSFAGKRWTPTTRTTTIRRPRRGP